MRWGVRPVSGRPAGQYPILSKIGVAPGPLQGRVVDASLSNAASVVAGPLQGRRCRPPLSNGGRSSLFSRRPSRLMLLRSLVGLIGVSLSGEAIKQVRCRNRPRERSFSWHRRKPPCGRRLRVSGFGRCGAGLRGTTPRVETLAPHGAFAPCKSCKSDNAGAVGWLGTAREGTGDRADDEFALERAALDTRPGGVEAASSSEMRRGRLRPTRPPFRPPRFIAPP